MTALLTKRIKSTDVVPSGREKNRKVSDLAFHTGSENLNPFQSRGGNSSYSA